MKGGIWKLKENVFDTERLVPTYFKQALPVVLGLVVTVVYNLVDTYFIAQTNDPSLVAGVSICGPVFIILMAVGNIYGQGASSLVARLLGQEDKKKVQEISAFVFYLAIVSGAILAVPMLVFSTPILRVLGSSQQTLPHAREYYTILSYGAPVIILNFIHSALLRCEGKAAESMYGTVLGAVVNMILDPIFISGLGWGAAGAAWATVVGYIVSDLFLLVIVLRKSRYFSVDLRRCRVSGKDMGQILSVGVTFALTNIASSAATIVMNQFLLTYGDEKIAAMGIVSRINMFTLLILTGFAFGGMPLFGYLFGAGQIDRLRKLLRFCLSFIGALALALTVLVFTLAPHLVRIFMDNASIITDGTTMLRWQVSGSVFAGVVMLLTCLFQGLGKALPALILSLSRQGVLFLAVMLVAIMVAGYQGFLASQLIADLLSAALALGLYRRILRKMTSVPV